MVVASCFVSDFSLPSVAIFSIWCAASNPQGSADRTLLLFEIRFLRPADEIRMFFSAYSFGDTDLSYFTKAGKCTSWDFIGFIR